MGLTVNELNELNRYTDELTDYFYELKERAGDKNLMAFSEIRNIPIEEIKRSDIFYVGDATELLLPTYIDKVDSFGVISPTNKKPIFHNRYVIPIKDVNGKILNFVGYSKEADERYVYGTARYYRRRETMYGLENLKYAYELGFAYLTEGITDTIRVRSLGRRNCFANCGTHESAFIMNQLNRCEHGVIKIPDRDAAGKRAAKKWVCYRGIILNVHIAFKDIDEMCRESTENQEIVNEYLDACEDWILLAKHHGKGCISQEITIN